MDDQLGLQNHNHLDADTDTVFQEANALCAQFEQSGNPEYLDSAIELLSEVAKLAHINQSKHAAYLDELAALHMQRFERRGKIEDINTSIELYDKAISVTSKTDPDLPKRLQGLGDALQSRYDVINSPSDIERSIECQDKAVMLRRGDDENTAPFNKVSADAPLSTIDDSMSTTEVLGLLMEHGCSDMTSNIELLSEIPVSEGGFGRVYRGKLRNGSEVAVKVLRMRTDEKGCKALLRYAARELYAWSKCDHPNVLELLGLAEIHGQIAMVSPWMVNGPVGLFLGRQDMPVDRCSMCAQVAEGLVYLHAGNIVHGDIKGLNVLVSSDHTLKLTDFGNAALVKDYSLCFAASTSAGKAPTLRWAAPEVLQGGDFTREADVYALGMTIFEILTGLIPFEGKSEIQAMTAILNNKHPAQPQESIPSSSKQGDIMWALLVRCWDSKPKTRPTAVEVRDQVIPITSEGLLPKSSGEAC
ncbi:hypothetical protein FRC07_009066 [Ceratobasidium sp. 392]|nr:hypothetical protein FRC07_009066 [Ceratobasidium sp. 392]